MHSVLDVQEIHALRVCFLHPHKGRLLVFVSRRLRENCRGKLVRISHLDSLFTAVLVVNYEPQPAWDVRSLLSDIL